ncbi:MAG: hypothetical protein ACLUKN_08910 [Bacilli bacterium]
MPTTMLAIRFRDGLKRQHHAFRVRPHAQPAKTTYADGNFKSAAYTSASLVLSETDELGNTVEYAYDAMGHILSRRLRGRYLRRRGA